MTYQQTLEDLYSRLPLFSRIGSAAYKEDLHNTITLCDAVGNPQTTFKSIHIAGTNGKGSTSHMLAAILQEAGYKTGLYTSPHLKDFRERIRINGEMISEQQVIDFVADHQSDFEDIQPSFFEMTVGLAFDIFAKDDSAPLSHGVTISGSKLPPIGTKGPIDLHVRVLEGSGGITLFAAYSLDRFRGGPIREMLGALRDLVLAVIANPESPLSRFSIKSVGDNR